MVAVSSTRPEDGVRYPGYRPPSPAEALSWLHRRRRRIPRRPAAQAVASGGSHPARRSTRLAATAEAAYLPVHLRQLPAGRAGIYRYG
jgi:hypothetical protein